MKPEIRVYIIAAGISLLVSLATCFAVQKLSARTSIQTRQALSADATTISMSIDAQTRQQQFQASQERLRKATGY